jgi:hypothetical protein
VKAENVGEGTKKEQTLAHRTAPDEPDAPLTCSERHRPYSTALQRTVVPRSGRRGRRFKSCHPDRVSAGQRPAPEMVGASLLPVQQQKHGKYSNDNEIWPARRRAPLSLLCASHGTKRLQAQILSPRPEFPQVIPEGKRQKEHSRSSRQPALRFAGRHRAGVRIDTRRHRHVCVTPDRMITLSFNVVCAVMAALISSVITRSSRMLRALHPKPMASGTR